MPHKPPLQHSRVFIPLYRCAGSFPCIDALLFPVVAGRGAFQEGDEEARLHGLKSGFIFFILGGKAWELFLSDCFQMVLLEHKDF